MNILGLISVPDWLLATALILTAIYKYLTWNFGYWSSQNVRTRTPIPLMGTLLPAFRRPMSDIDIANMKEFGNVWGSYIGRNPELMTADMDMIKTVTIKDFHNFADRRSVTLAGASGVTRYFLVFLKGDEWKAHRSVLTPTFTSGKLKQMGALMEDCSKELNQFVTKSIEDGKTEFEMKDLFGSYTMNVIGTCCFGYKIDSQNPNDPFIVYTKGLFSRSVSFRAIMSFLMPKVFEYFRISIFPDKSLKYFEKTVNQVIAMRKEQKNRRGDFLDLLMYAEKDGFAEKQSSEEIDLSHYDIGSELKENVKIHDGKKEKVLNADAVVAHSMLFLLAGYDSTASMIGYAAYFLALYPDCQEKLVKEIDETIKDHGKLNFDTVGKMPYLDKVVSETLRFYPPSLRIERRCIKPCRLGEIEIAENMMVGIPVYAIHHSDRYYPNPEKFDPERFSPENKARRNPASYIPFGIGPRNCVGMRFALIQAKIALANLIREFRFSKCSKTEVPLTMEVGNGLLKPVNGIHISIEKRN